MRYILTIDQSTQGTKVLIVDKNGKMVARVDKPHRQIVDEMGYVCHDAEEIYQNVLSLVPMAIKSAGINKSDIVAVGITNQRETTVMFNKDGKALANAVVWQCARGREIVDLLQQHKDAVYKKTGLPLSPYFSAAKMAWLLKHVKYEDEIHFGTIDTWLVYKLTGKFYTDYSNASRTQLFNIHTLTWDEELCIMFGIKKNMLANIVDSDGDFGSTDFNGFFKKPIPICAVLGDSHAALYSQGCVKNGMTKATYGTGSSVMMNIGDRLVHSLYGLSTSLAWRINGKIDYVLEGNINYSAAVISWLKDGLCLVESAEETSVLAKKAHPNDTTVLVPAFSGLSAPYWNSLAKASFVGMTRLTGKNEIVRAALESIAFQVNAVLNAMVADSGLSVKNLYVDGGAVNNEYLMQFQSDISGVQVVVPAYVELSAYGAALLAGKKIDMLAKEKNNKSFNAVMKQEAKEQKLALWNNAVKNI